MLDTYLANYGFMVYPANNSKEIELRISSSRIDLILLDIKLGNEDGIEICEKLRDNHNVPIIFVSTLSSDQQRVAGYAVGADDYIAKPFNPELLLAELRPS